MAAQIFTNNSKTLLSVDFDRFKTCPQICDYCYVGNSERLYPAYKTKLTSNHEWSIKDPKSFASTLNAEYKKYRSSKSKIYDRLNKLPVRIYGSGDFIPEHLEWLKRLTFKFFIISKSLTNKDLFHYINKLLKLDNLTKVILSLDNQNIENYNRIKNLYSTDKIGISYTGLADDFNGWKAVGIKTNIFFNTSNKKVEKQKSRGIKEQCPCDSGLLAHAKSCSYCSKCWKSSITRGNTWNTISQTVH